MRRRLSIIVLSTLLAARTTSACDVDSELLAFRLPATESWKRDHDAGTVILRRAPGITMVFRVGHGDGKSASGWFRDGARAAAAAGAVLIRDPAERRLGGRPWIEARFRTVERDRRTAVTTVGSATDYGPCVLEAYVRAPSRSIDSVLADFDRLRARLNPGVLGCVRRKDLEAVAKPSLVGTWSLREHAPRTNRARLEKEVWRFGQQGRLEVETPERTTALSYTMRPAGTLSTAGMDGAPTRAHSCFRLRRRQLPRGTEVKLPASRLRAGDLILVERAAPGHSIGVRVLRSSDRPLSAGLSPRSHPDG